jgi:hypothetical protein
MTGIHRGSLVAAGTTLAAALVALAFVPARAAAESASTSTELPAGLAADVGAADGLASGADGLVSRADGQASVAQVPAAER